MCSRILFSHVLAFASESFSSILSFVPSFVDLWVSAREFEREDRRIQDAWMRKVMRREPVPCDSLMNPCQWRRRSSLSTGSSPFTFRYFHVCNRGIVIVKFALFIQMQEPSRARVEVVSRVTSTHHAKSPNTRQISARLRVCFPRIHTSCIRKQCAYETVWKSGDRGFMSLL